MSLFKCPECQDLISTEADFCPKCGFDVFTYMEENGNKIQCNQCWSLNLPDAKICSKCGNNLQYSNKVSQGMPKEELEIEKKNMEDRKTFPIIMAIIISAFILFFIFPNLIFIIHFKLI